MEEGGSGGLTPVGVSGSQCFDDHLLRTIRATAARGRNAEAMPNCRKRIQSAENGVADLLLSNAMAQTNVHGLDSKDRLSDLTIKYNENDCQFYDSLRI